MNRIATALEGILAFLKGTKITVAGSPTPAEKTPPAAAASTTAPKDKAPPKDKDKDKAATTKALKDAAAKDTKGDAGAVKPAYTQDQVREIVKRLAADEARGGRDAALAILADKGGGAKAVKYLDAKFFDAVYDATEAILDAELPGSEDDPTEGVEEEGID